MVNRLKLKISSLRQVNIAINYLSKVKNIHDSRDFLSMEDTPKSITFIGGGIISIEFASIMIKTGADVHVVHHTDEILPGFNRNHVDKLVKIRR